MSLRYRITLLFTLFVFIILGLVCSSIYFFSSNSRVKYIDYRLTNMAITAGNLLSREEIFSKTLISKIDSLTTIAFTHKTIQAYDNSNNKIYSFNDDDEDALNIPAKKLDEAREKNKIFTKIGDRDIVLYDYIDRKTNLVIIAAGFDLIGYRNLKNLQWILLLSFLAGIVISLLSGYFFSRRLLRPLSRIADEVNEISAQNLARRIHTGTSADEWHYLASTVNNLLNRLQESFEMQSRFISNASHELSTPLTAVSSQLEVSMQKERSKEEYKNVIQSIYQDIQHMSKLTHTLLELAKASGSKIGIEIKPVRIDEVLLRLPPSMSKINTGYSVALDFSKLPESPESLIIFGNEELLFSAIHNITLNACKYSDDHRALVTLENDQGTILIKICNTGTGIPPHEIENIFQPFYRIDENLAGGGFGLGLSLAKRIIKLHDGEIDVKSRQGEETCFTVSLKQSEL
jgi:signal transduction histidine kinase